MGQASESVRLSSGRFLALFASLGLLCALPLFLTPLPPLLDFPNHLARMHLLPSLPSPALERFYAVAWAPLPNLAMDGLVPLLARFMPLLWAGKLFVVLTFLLLAGGAAAIHRVLFRFWSPWSCLAFLLLYSRLLLWGFLGFLFGCGLALFAFAAWLGLRERHWLLRIALGCVFATAIYLAHLLAFGIYAVMIAGLELGALWRSRPKLGAAMRDLAIGGLPFLPALILMALNSSTGRILYADPLRKLDLLFSVFDNYSRPFDVACFALLVVAIAIAFLRGWLRLAPQMAGPLLGLVLLYLAMPSQLFTAAGADRRIPLMIFLALIGGSHWSPTFGRWERRFLAGAAALLVVRLAMICLVWRQGGALYEEALPGIDALPHGACVAVAMDRDGISVQKVPLTHFPVLAVARRDAFVTTLFALPRQQPITLTPEAAALADALSADALWSDFVQGAPPLAPPTRDALLACGHVAFAGTKPFTLAKPAGLEPIFVMPRLQIYRVAPAGFSRR